MARGKESNETSKQTSAQGNRSEQQTAQQSGEQQQNRQQMTTGQGGGQSRPTSLSRRDQQSFAPALWSSPFSFMRRFGEDMDRLFEDFGFGRGLIQRDLAQMAGWTPQVDVSEQDGNLVVRADLPGMTPDDVQVEITDSAIALQGERRKEHEEQREGAYVSEVSYGTFYRAIPLPEGADTENARATFRDGVLEITVPLAQREQRRRQLEIQDSSEAGQQQQKTRAAGAKG